ncbi:MAG: ATP-binding protein [Peptococcaceae bacterium]|nr:ATP-binding protein [Peptococcaceae bacterium]
MEIKSQIEPMLTLDYMTTAPENKYFDRKSARIKVADLAELISAFANAEGGTVVIGISDKTKRIEGIAQVGEQKINDFLSAPKDYCKPMPQYKEEFLDVMNAEGNKDQLLLLHIFSSPEQLIRTKNDLTWLRIGDRTKEIRGEDLRLLEYSKNTRLYEDELHPDAAIEDLDETLLEEYRQRLDADPSTSIEQILRSRGFIKGDSLTNGAVLLFAKKYLPVLS